MKQLKPLLLRDKYWASIEAEINRILYTFIYAPLIYTLKIQHTELMNTGNALVDAVKEGFVWYEDGHFAGQFNSTITKELKAIGAVFNAPSKTFSLVRELLPPDIRSAQAIADDRYDKLRKSFLTTLDDMHLETIDKLSEIPDEYMQTIEWMDEDFKKGVEGISIAPVLTEAQKGIIAAEWGQNLDKYIKDWAVENILKLRNQVQANTFEGRRAVELVDMLKSNYAVSRNKARFLARQETSLLLSKFRETRYRSIGANRYRWSTSHDERVRHDHKDLNGKIFSFDMPPVTNRRTGARNNPGEDFGCRCVAIGLVE